MAINYPDYTASYTLGETEEERKRREAEEAARAAEIGLPPPAPVAPDISLTAQPTDLANTEVHTQTVKTYGDGSQEEITKRQIPAPVAPEPQAVEQPPQPQPQAEAPQPAQPQMSMAQQAHAQELAAQGQPAPAPAPAAPVAPQPQTAAPAPQPSTQFNANAPVPNIGQVPTPGEPTELAGPMVQGAVKEPFTGQGMRMPQAPAANLAQVAQQLGQTGPTFESRFTEASNDTGKLDQLRRDESLTKEQRRLAGIQMQELLRKELGPIKGKEEIDNMNEGQIAKLLKSKSEEGSWAKMILLGLISPDLAGKEAAKLGLNDKWSVGMNTEGNPVLLKTRDGVPIEGYDATTDKKLSAKELISAAGTAPGKVKPDVSTQDVEKNGQAGRVVTTYDAQNRPRTMVESGGKMFPYDTSWKPRSIATAAEKAVQGKQISLAYDPIIEAAKKGAGYLGEFNAKHGTNFNILGYGQNKEPIIVDSNNNQVVQKNNNGTVNAVVAENPEAKNTTTTTSNGNAVRVVSGGGGKTPAQIEQSMALGKKQAEANIELNKEVAAAEQKVPAEAKGKNQAKDINDQRQADETYKIIQPISDAIKKSTGSSIGAGVDTLAGVIGVGTEGAQNIAKLEVLSYKLLQQVPRMEGSQSNIDVEMYKKAAGDLGNDKKSIPVRLAALDTIIEMLKMADKKGNNDWSFSGQAPAGAASTGVKWKVVKP